MSGGNVSTTTPHHTMKLTIQSSPVTVLEKGAQILVLGGSLWVRRDALGPLVSSGVYDFEIEVTVRDVATANGNYTSLRVERILSAKPCK